MSGLRLYSFREGDRSEYAANYLLSGLGLVTAVPRQEDIGVDFYCNLADQESGNLTFGYPFIVQVKSDSGTPIIYGESDLKKWKSEHISWLFRLELPLFIGIVDKREMRIDLFSTSALWFVYQFHRDASKIEFRPRRTVLGTEVHQPVEEDLPDFTGSGKGNGKKYIVDLGEPLITISNSDIYNPETLAHKKRILRTAIEMEEKNHIYRKLSLLHFEWVHKIETDRYFTGAWIHSSTDDVSVIETYLRSLAPGLISMALNAKSSKNEELKNLLIPILKLIPTDLIPTVMIGLHPDIFKT